MISSEEIFLLLFVVLTLVRFDSILALQNFDSIELKIEKEVISFQKENFILSIMEDLKEKYFVYQDDFIIAAVPPFARYAYEIWIMPKIQMAGPWQFNENQIESFANGSLKAVSVKARKDGMLVNRELKSIKSDMPDTDTFVPAIYRKGKPLIPDGKTIIKESSLLFCMTFYILIKIKFLFHYNEIILFFSFLD